MSEDKWKLFHWRAFEWISFDEELLAPYGGDEMRGKCLSQKIAVSSSSQPCGAFAPAMESYQLVWGDCTHFHPNKVKTPYSLLRKSRMLLGVRESGNEDAFSLF